MSLRRIVRELRDPTRADIIIAAPADQVRRIVHDPVRMAALGQEITEVHYIDGATAPAVGVRFQGLNRNGPRRWATTCTITDCSDTRFGYSVRAGTDTIGFDVSRWQYDLEPLGPSSTRLTETNWVTAPLIAAPLAIAVTGVIDRRSANATHIAQTLDRVRAEVEQNAADVHDGH